MYHLERKDSVINHMVKAKMKIKRHISETFVM